jgi:Family of unknown function (DUF6049)
VKRLLATVVSLLLSGGPALAPNPHHARHRQPAAKPPVDVILSAIGPKYIGRTTRTVRLQGLVLNQSETPYQRVSVRLRFGGRAMSSRGELETYSDGKGADPPLASTGRTVSASLAPGTRQGWTLSLPVSRMGMRAFGVYPISVEALAATGAVLGRQRTFVTYYPGGTDTARTRISWVWPVADQPHRADDATFVDDRLQDQLAGRLQHIVGAAARTQTPVSWLVDPSLVDDAMAMSAKGGYAVKGARRPQSTAAAAWLSALKGAIGTDRLVATPYADPDVNALSRARMAKDAKTATDVAAPTLARAGLGGATTSVAMPPGDIDQQTLADLVANGARTIVLNSGILPDAQTQTFTSDPLVRRIISGTDVRLIAYDDTLRDVLSTDTNRPGAAFLAEQRFLAETAMITGEVPHHPRTVVVMPPRRWNPDPRFARDLLSYSSKAPWLHAVSLHDVEALRPGGRAFQPRRQTPGLTGGYLRNVRSLSGRIGLFTSIFQPPASGFTLGPARAESSAWVGQPRRGRALRKALDSELSRAAGKIKVLNDGITMAGKSARIPITISNGLARGTVAVRLRASSQNDTRLRVEGEDRTLVLEAGHKEQVTLNMKAAANGPAYVNLDLLAPDGRPFGETRVLVVRATAYGRTALVITGVSLAVLFLGVGFRILRRRGNGTEKSGG